MSTHEVTQIGISKSQPDVNSPAEQRQAQGSVRVLHEDERALSEEGSHLEQNQVHALRRDRPPERQMGPKKK
ncbi:hypothetical protein L798_07927 [Zootermopsis nevadensis]|uniref:Uncharacterized protein n=1 Tax=Zootermopsis nevadensis TaxID=136037 RepID=A0A067RLS5_ZOONE|nr:hypothetical protein L798_07927 [Zootermopsis nevadensis]